MDQNIAEIIARHQGFMFNSLATERATPVAVGCPCITMITETIQEQEGSNPMYIDNEADLTAKRIRHLKSRADDVYSEKRNELRKQFNIDDTRLLSAEQLIDAIKNGQYILDEKEAKREGYGLTHGISFRDPTKPADRLGYDMAKIKLAAALQDTKDVIIVSDPEYNGLEALINFKSWQLS